VLSFRRGLDRWLVRHRLARLLLVLALAAGAAALALHQAWLRIPASWTPWGEVRLDQPPGWLSRLQVNGLADDPPSCFAALERADIGHARLAERPVRDGCGMAAGARLTRSRVRYGRAVEATCAVVAALAWYEGELDALAQAQLGSRLARIDHLGTYACRNVNDAAEGRRSQHATANAIDIAGFALANGATVTVARDWGRDTPEGRFLRLAHHAACGLFNVVLGPEYNAAHADHFHLDLGRARLCR